MCQRRMLGDGKTACSRPMTSRQQYSTATTVMHHQSVLPCPRLLCWHISRAKSTDLSTDLSTDQVFSHPRLHLSHSFTMPDTARCRTGRSGRRRLLVAASTSLRLTHFIFGSRNVKRLRTRLRNAASFACHTTARESKLKTRPLTSES